MKRAAWCILLALLLPMIGGADNSAPTTSSAPDAPVSFSAIDVFIDPHGKPLAAWQFELVATTGDVTLVGVEGGEHPAFSPAPYYDPAALMGKRIVVAAFNVGQNLPSAKTRVARLHVQIKGNVEPNYDLSLQVAASSDAKTIPATISISSPASAPSAKGAKP